MNEITNLFLPESLRSLNGEKFLGNLISNLLSLFLIAGVIIALFLLIIGGLQWMLSGGDKAAAQAARGRITATIIGLLLLFSAWAIIKLIETFLGITILGGPIKVPTIGQ